MNKKKVVINIGMVAIFAAITFLIPYIIYLDGTYPNGSDTFAHLYKGQMLYQALKEGNLYPMYDPYWYNGVQMLRYWAPLPVYFLAACDF